MFSLKNLKSYQFVKRHSSALAVSAAAGLTVVSTSANAAIPASVTTAFADLATDFQTLIDTMIPIVVLVAASFAIVRFIRRAIGAL